MRKNTRFWLGQIVMALPLLWVASPVQAQEIIPDNSLGVESSLINPINPQQVNINGGATRGANLFHSFLKFNISEGHAAYFANPPGVENILSRVTGNDPSHLLGTLGVAGNANLFFLNPNGILFGPNAQLDIQGSFVASTADSFIFDDGSQFSATNPSAVPLLTVSASAPVGLRFEGQQAGSIVNAGNLAVPEAQSLSLVGGTVINTGTLSVPQGNVTVMAVPESGQAQLNSSGTIDRWQPQTPTANRTTQPLTLPELLNSYGGGDLGVVIDAVGNIRLAQTDTSIPVVNGTSIVAGEVNVGGITGGNVQVLGNRVALFDADINATGTQAGGTVLVGGDYRGQGNLLNAARTVVDENSRIDADAIESGNGGRVIVWADEVAGFYGDISATGGSDFGDGGFVEVSGKENLVFRGEVDVSAVNGSFGTLLLDPENIVIVPGAAGTGLNDNELADDEILEGDSPGNTFFISEGTLEALNGNANIILEAANDITISDLPDNNLTFQRGLGSIIFRAGGAFSMNQRDTIVVGSAENQPIRRQITIEAGSINLGNINTKTGSLTAPGSSVWLYASGDITTANIESFTIDPNYISNNPSVSPTNPFNAGDITIISNQGKIDTSAGSLSSTSFGGTIGNIYLQAAGDIITSNIGNGGGSSSQVKGGNITLISGGNIDSTHRSRVPNIVGTSGLTRLISFAGKIDIQAVGNIRVGDIITGYGAVERQPQSITITSQTGDIDTTSGLIQSLVAFSAGPVSLSSTPGDNNDRIIIDAHKGNVRISNIWSISGNNQPSGNVIINAPQGDVSFFENASSNVAGILTRSEEGISGNIDISARTITQRSATARLVSFGRQQSGTVSITTDILALDRDSELIFTSNSNGTPQSLRLTTNTLILEDGSRISASTSGSSQAPNFVVQVNDSAVISGRRADGTPGGIFFNTQSNGNAGKFIFSALSLRMDSGAQISNTVSNGNGGGSEINAETINVGSEGAILFENQGPGDADGLRINVEGGAITLEDGAEFNVSGTGTGSGGVLRIIADSLTLRNNSQLNASTASGTGGDIDVWVRDSILLRFNSDIRAEARGTGDGGNITLTAGGLILAFPSEDSDIIATAIGGRGGNIQFTAAGVFGFLFDRVVDTPKSDTTASSRFGVDGTVTFNIRNNFQIELPQYFSDRNQVTSERCELSDRDVAIKYFNRGREGYSISPSEPFGGNYEAPWVSFNEQRSSELSRTEPSYQDRERFNLMNCQELLEQAN